MSAIGRSKCIRLAVLFTGISLLPSVWADGYRNPPPGPELGRAGNAAAGAQGASALLYNPARLADLEARTSTLSFSLAQTKIDWSGPGGASASSKDPWQLLPNLYVGAPLPDSPWSWGLGLETPFGQSVEWSKDAPFRYTSPYFAQISMIGITPAVARHLSSTVSVGAGLDLYLSEIEFKQRVPWGAVLGVPGMPDGEIKATGDGSAVGGRLGVTWDVAPDHRLAFSYRSRFRVNYDGDFSVQGVPPPLNVGARDFSTQVRYPDILAAGYGVRLTENWTAEVQVEWLSGSVNKTQPIEVEAPYTPLVQQSRIENNWKDTWTYGIGTDWTFAPGWVARAGYMFMESPVPDETISPLLPDADRDVFAVGLGRQFGPHSLDLAYTYNRFHTRTTPTGRYEYQANLIGISYAFRF